MFAVPGWSVSADTPKTQEELKFPKSAQKPEPQDQHQDQNGDVHKTSAKRKRKQGHSAGPLVTDENLADLWKKYIEVRHTTADGRENKTELESEQKRPKRRKDGTGESKLAHGIENHSLAHQSLQSRQEDITKKCEDSNQLGAETKGSTVSTSDEVLLEIPTHPSHSSDSKLSGKAKYQHRKLLALKKKQLKARLQVTGSLPPSRPNLLSQSTIIENAETSPPPEPAAGSVLSPQPSPTSPNSTSAATSTTLTPLQAQMRSKLIAARFRHLNETLYTTASTHAFNLFTESPSSFASYHAGFRAQVSVWPQNPVDTFIKDLKARAPLSAKKFLHSQKKQWRDERKGKKQDPKALLEASNNSKLAPLPRSQSGFCTIADLGCGDAKLAASILPHAVPHSLRVLSYDLSSGDGPNAALITVADLCRLPLKDDEIDVAVLCLALMGTNWIDGVDEVRRVVRPGGEVWVAEIRSRFQTGVGKDKRQANPKSQSKRSQHSTTSNAIDDDDDDYDENGNLALDLDTEPHPKLRNSPDTHLPNRESGELFEIEARDIDPFLDIWRRRGFTLSEPIDQSNRMFIRMKFTKQRTSPDFLMDGSKRGEDRSHGVDGLREGKSTGATTWMAKNKKGGMNVNGTGTGTGNRSRGGNTQDSKRNTWIGTFNKNKDEVDPAKLREEEAKVLKPCVYKLR